MYTVEIKIHFGLYKISESYIRAHRLPNYFALRNYHVYITQDKDLHVNVNDKPIACVNEYKCLGVIIDSYLDFRSHTYKVAKEVKQKLGILRRLKTSFSVQQLSQIYWGYVMPHMLYCCNVWTGRSDVNYDILNRLHKRAAYYLI